ncbi:hypothetical protein AB0I81_53055 [Nonomuraea sp. NPDC050404]|uniref:hypothetical protein n=1 Tax=Nonomuraea sp. NPDC050404 TaxID=3155783 RepID=UPI00340B9266
MHEHSLSVSPTTIEQAQAWIRALVDPESADDAATIIGDLVGAAGVRTPPGGRIQLAATSQHGELTIEVRTASPDMSSGNGPDWSKCSNRAWSMATRQTDSGYIAMAKVNCPRRAEP